MQHPLLKCQRYQPDVEEGCVIFQVWWLLLPSSPLSILLLLMFIPSNKYSGTWAPYGPIGQSSLTEVPTSPQMDKLLFIAMPPLVITASPSYSFWAVVDQSQKNYYFQPKQRPRRHCQYFLENESGRNAEENGCSIDMSSEASASLLFLAVLMLKICHPVFPKSAWW